MKFDKIFESYFPTTIKTIVRSRYPKQIQFSEEFVKAIDKEFKRLQTIKENEQETEVQPIKKLKEKFVKAVQFCVHGF
jgi:cysteinyl-tRNA synthetase